MNTSPNQMIQKIRLLNVEESLKMQYFKHEIEVKLISNNLRRVKVE